MCFVYLKYHDITIQLVGAVHPGEVKEDSLTKVVVEQPLALPGYAYHTFLTQSSDVNFYPPYHVEKFSNFPLFPRYNWCAAPLVLPVRGPSVVRSDSSNSPTPATNSTKLERFSFAVSCHQTSNKKIFGFFSEFFILKEGENTFYVQCSTYSHMIRLDWSSSTPFDPWPLVIINMQ